MSETQTPTELKPQTEAEEFTLLVRPTLWQSLREEIRARFGPPPPPLELDSKPVPVKSIWTEEDLPAKAKSKASSLLVHILVILLLTLPIFHRQVGNAFRSVARITPLYLPVTPPGPKRMSGGGGGPHARRPPNRGKLPKFLRVVKAPPVVKPPKLENPILTVTPAILMPRHMILPQPNLPVLGQPQIAISKPGGALNTGGIGSGRGNGYGPGEGGGAGGGAYATGAGITDPVIIYDPDPEFTNAAREAKYSGTVVLWVTVGSDGHVHDIEVARKLGLGLDQKAIEAAKKWRFRPAMKNGKPVPVRVAISISFRLY